MILENDQTNLSDDIFEPIFEDFKKMISNFFKNSKQFKFSRIFLAGGCSKMPKIKTIVENVSKISVDLPENPETIVARGCAIYCQEFYKIYASKIQ